jgi:hypothetical protein
MCVRLDEGTDGYAAKRSRDAAVVVLELRAEADARS